MLDSNITTEYTDYEEVNEKGEGFDQQYRVE